MARRKTKNFDYTALKMIAITFCLFQLLLAPVHSQRERERIRGDNLYVRADRDRLSGNYVYQRPSRGTTPPSSSSNNDNDNDNDLTNSPNDSDSDTNGNNNNNEMNELTPIPNLVLVPQCDPTDPISFYNDANNALMLEDKTSDCDRYLQYCQKKHSSLAFDSWASFVFPQDFYDTVELLYDRCLSSCSQALPGGLEEFCTMPEPPLQTPADSSYCFSTEHNTQGGGLWTDEMIAHEEKVLMALNKVRDDPAGGTCTRRIYNPQTGTVSVIEGFFPRSSPVVPNEALRCAARIQARNIVEETIERNGAFPRNLHDACPSRGDAICEDFSTRMDKAGYEYFENGFGYINEVTAAGYQSAMAVVRGWKGSTSGHCEAILKQESKIVPTEVGIGFYKDPNSDMTGHVVIVAQRNL